MQKFYFKVLKTLKTRFSKFRNFVSGSIFGEPQLTQMSLNFKTSCSNLKIRGLGKTLCVASLYLCFFLEKFYFKQNCTPFFHVKRRY